MQKQLSVQQKHEASLLLHLLPIFWLEQKQCRVFTYPYGERATFLLILVVVIRWWRSWWRIGIGTIGPRTVRHIYPVQDILHRSSFLTASHKPYAISIKTTEVFVFLVRFSSFLCSHAHARLSTDLSFSLLERQDMRIEMGIIGQLSEELRRADDT